MLSIYQDVKTYTDSLTVEDVVTPRVVEFVNDNRDRLIRYDSKILGRILSTIEFDSHQVVKVVADLEVIFMNEINYKRVIKKFVKHKELKNQINPTSHTPSCDYKISFKHYNFYSMNEHDPD